jgi:hypothetical protein
MTILRNDDDYRKFAAKCLTECYGDRDEALLHYLDECNTVYIEDDHGPREAYLKSMAELFNYEADKYRNYPEIVVEAKRFVERRTEFQNKVSVMEEALRDLAIEVRDQHGDEKLREFAHDIATGFDFISNLIEN